MLNMHSELIFNRIDHRGLATGLASECNEIKLPYISKIPCGLAAGFFIVDLNVAKSRRPAGDKYATVSKVELLVMK
jgi:hypothetical protein